MGNLEEKLANAMFTADSLCQFAHGCKNGADCKKCDLLALDCKRTYIARYLLDNFDIRLKVAPVVRCKECKYYGDEHFCPLLSLADYTDPDDFCSYGERKEEPNGTD